jgi:hypothetical protein
MKFIESCRAKHGLQRGGSKGAYPGAGLVALGEDIGHDGSIGVVAIDVVVCELEASCASSGGGIWCHLLKP